MNDMTNVFKYILLAFLVMLNKFIKMFIDFSKQKGDPDINSGLPNLANNFCELGGNILFVRMVYDACVCHVPVRGVKKTFYLRI